MGIGESKDDKKVLEEVRKQSKYSIGELKQWYSKFLNEYPNGQINISQFKELYGKFYPDGDKAAFAAFAEHNFRIFDVNKDGMINFREFMVALSAQCRGTCEEKMKWMFSLFDINGNGLITIKEMETIMSSMYKINKDVQHEKTAAEHVAKVYKKLDKNMDGELTLEEFVKLGNTDPKLLDLVCGFNQ